MVTMKSFVIDCSVCQAGPEDCGDCLMACLAAPASGSGSGPVVFSQAERDALAVMAEAGLVPRLRLVA